MVVALYNVPRATARSHLPVSARVVKTLTTMQIILHIIDLTMERFRDPSIFLNKNYWKLKYFQYNRKVVIRLSGIRKSVS